MRKYFKLKPRKIKIVSGDIVDKYPHLQIVPYSLKIGDSDGFECWICEGIKEEINQFINDKLSNPRFEDVDSKMKDHWTGKIYSDQADMLLGKLDGSTEEIDEHKVTQDEIDNPGFIEEITEDTAKIYLETGKSIEEFYKEKNQTEILLESIVANTEINQDLKDIITLIVNREE